jgi:FMN phosphatase YigB (HAD superfamily)
VAYQSPNLSVLSYANGFTLWHYRTTDLAADVDNVGYFNPATDALHVGDTPEADGAGAQAAGLDHRIIARDGAHAPGAIASLTEILPLVA